MNQTDVSNTNNIFTPPTTPISCEEDHPAQDFNEATENEFIQENFVFVSALKQQQQPHQQQAFSIQEIISDKKEQVIEFIRMYPLYGI